MWYLKATDKELGEIARRKRNIKKGESTLFWMEGPSDFTMEWESKWNASLSGWGMSQCEIQRVKTSR